MNTKSLSLSLVALLGLTSITHAALTFSFTGTITQDEGNAFTLGESFTLTMTTRNDVGAPNLINDATGVRWLHDSVLDAPIWETVTLSGATGSYIGATSGSDPANGLRSDPTRKLYVLAATHSTTDDLGIFKGGEEFSFFDIWLNAAEAIATYAGDASVTPDNTFINGDYTPTSTVGAFFYTEGYDNEYKANITSFSITTAAVPEPSSTVLLGLGGLALLARRRK